MKVKIYLACPFARSTRRLRAFSCPLPPRCRQLSPFSNLNVTHLTSVGVGAAMPDIGAATLGASDTAVVQRRFLRMQGPALSRGFSGMREEFPAFPQHFTPSLGGGHAYLYYEFPRPRLTPFPGPLSAPTSTFGATPLSFVSKVEKRLKVQATTTTVVVLCLCRVR